MAASQTIPQVFNRVVESRPGSAAVIDERGTTTYGELHTMADSAARALMHLGVQPGDHVACLMPNRVEWIVSFLATAKVGATFVPLNTWYKKTELEWTLRHTSASTVLSVPGFLNQDYVALMQDIEPGIGVGAPGETRGRALPHLRTVVYLGSPRRGAFGWNEFLALGARSAYDEFDSRQAGVAGMDPLMVLYTSGSTADPKGVVLPHGGVVANGYGIGDRREIGADDIMWLGSPLFYGLGAANALPVALTRGATLLLQDQFDEEVALSLIERHQATVFYGMSNMIRRIHDAPGFSRRRIASLTKGTAGIEREERRLLISEMGVARATNSYGSTEVCGNCLGGYPDDPLELKMDTCGTLLPGFEAMIVDPLTDEPLTAGEIGLLKVRGNTALGYLHSESETRAAFGTDGFYSTGDLGAFDADGYFRYGARMKEMIKTGGINVSPVEIESLLTSHRSISEAYVVSVPDRTRGEAVVSFVVTTEELSEADVQQYVRSIAANFKAPARVIFVDGASIPRTASGKVPKQQLRTEALRTLGLDEGA